MTVAEKNIIDTYFKMFKNLNLDVKSVLWKKIDEDFKATEKKSVSETENPMSEKEKLFYSSFGGWESDLSPEAEVAQLRAARRFRKKDISLD